MTNTTIPPETGGRTLHCPGCDRTVTVASDRAAFCPHCGRRLRARHGPLAKVIGLAFLIGTAAVGYGSWKAYDSATTPVAPAAVRPPAGPVDTMLADAAAARSARVVELDRRADEIRNVRDPLAAQLAELSNLSARVTTAANRAADENRWPARVAGRTLQRPDADALLARIAQVTAVEQPAVDRDTAALDGITAAATTLRAELTDIALLRRDLAGQPAADARATIDQQATAYRDASAHLPDTAGLTADPVRPVDEAAVLR